MIYFAAIVVDELNEEVFFEWGKIEKGREKGGGGGGREGLDRSVKLRHKSVQLVAKVFSTSKFRTKYNLYNFVLQETSSTQTVEWNIVE